MKDSEDHPDNTKLVHEGWNSIREKKRGCTDFLCVLLLLAMWVGMTFVGLVSLGAIEDDNLRAGNPYRLTNAMDYNGDICGYDSSVKNKKYGYYLPDYTAVCVSKCPTSTNFQKFVCHYSVQDNVDSNPLLAYAYFIERKCMYQIKSKSYVNRCLPDVDVVTTALDFVSDASSTGNTSVPASQYEAAATSASSWFSDFLGDMYTLRGYVFGFGLGLTAGIAFLYLFLLRIPGLLFLILWGIILGIFVVMIVGSFLLWSLANTWSKDGDHNNYEVLTMRVIAYIGMGITALYFCLILVLRKRVQLAIAVVKQAARALTAMPTILLMPIIQAIGLAVFLVPWIIYVLFLASSGDVVTYTTTFPYEGQTYTSTYRSFTYTTNTKYAFLYMLFCWFWTSEFIIAFGQLSIALSFTCWYFTRDKSLLATDNVRWAMKTTGLHHLGTIAFGSLIIAVIKTIRAILTYIQKKAKKSKNKVLEYVICLIQCCMVCLEKIMKFMNKNAYIITAIYATSFCSSARKAFFLLLRNILRVAAVNMVAGFLLFIGSLFIPLVTTFLCYLALAYDDPLSAEVNGIISPLVFTFILSYWVSSMFLEIFGMGIETILMCFIADEEMFKPEDRFADAELMTTIQKTAQDAAKARIAPDTDAEVKIIEVKPAAQDPPMAYAQVVDKNEAVF